MNYLTRDEKKPDTIDVEKCYGIAGKIIDYIKKNVDVAIIGLSGGADSTLVATLCTQALGPDKVYGFSMPCSHTDIIMFNSRSRSLANHIKINHDTINIEPIVDAFNLAIPNMTALNEGNTRSRTRMCILYAMSNAIAECTPGERVRVIGTGNLSEDFIGYDTKGGDALADLFPIGELYKQEVYDMLDYFVDKEVITNDHIDRTPSAGLWEGQTDEEELGHSYNEMAPIVEVIRSRNLADTKFAPDVELSLSPLFHFVRNRHVANRHKHMAPPVCSVRPPQILSTTASTSYPAPFPFPSALLNSEAYK
jgi:NAD+ synthase